MSIHRPKGFSVNTPFDKRENNLDIIRLLLAILVVFSHSYPLALGSNDMEPFDLLTKHQVTGGRIAVFLFFVISGFLITASYERSKSLGLYLKKRVYRIYPAFVVVMLLAFFVVLPLSEGGLAKPTAGGRLIDFLVQTISLRQFSYTHAFLSNPYPGEINGSTWTIAYEFSCYIGVALLGLTGMLRRRSWIATIFAASLILSLIAARYNWHSERIALIPVYMAGVVFYRFRHNLALRSSWFGLSSVSLLIGSLFKYGWLLIFPFAGTCMLFFLAFHPRIRLHNFSQYGDFSYGTYLYAFPVQQLIAKNIGHAVRPLVLFSYACPITLLFAIASWYGVERWFLRSAHSPDLRTRSSDNLAMTYSPR